jgi:hypothetical protein
MKLRLAGLVLPLLLLFPGVVTAQDGVNCSVGVELFDAGYDACVVSLVPDSPSGAAILKAAQARWDAFAKELGTAATVLWLGPRPKTIADLWWLPLQ